MSIDHGVYGTDSVLVEGYANAYAITGKENGLEGSLKNPASSIYQIHRRVLINVNESYGMDIYHGLLGMGYKGKNDIIVLGLVPFTTVSKIDETQLIDGEPVTVGSYHAMNMAPQITMAKHISKTIIVGSSIIAMYDSMSKESAKGFSVDTGILVNIPMITIGISIQNIGYNKYWSTGKIDHKPLQLNTGISLKPLKRIALLSDISIIKERMIKNIAITYNLSSYIAIQLGMRDWGNSNQVRSGVSMKLSSFSLHYSYGTHPEIGDSHKFGITLGI